MDIDDNGSHLGSLRLSVKRRLLADANTFSVSEVFVNRDFFGYFELENDTVMVTADFPR